MDTFVILRRNGWQTPADLQSAAERSGAVGAEMAEDVRWIRTYVVPESDGSLGTVCIYQATSAEAITRHSSAADLPQTEVLPLADLVVVRPDPEPATTS